MRRDRTASACSRSSGTSWPRCGPTCSSCSSSYEGDLLMSHGTDAAVLESHWGGGAAPFGASWQKTMMWIFIVTDGLLFSGLLCGYGFLRMASTTPWPDRTAVFSIPFIAFMTFVLITSSATMGTAVTA